VDVWNQYVMGFIDSIGTWIEENKGPEEYDKKLLVNAGQLIMGGLYNGLSDAFENDVKPYVSDMADEIESVFGAPELSVGTNLGSVGKYAARRASASATNTMNLYIDNFYARDEREIENIANRLSILWRTEMEGTL